jgi:hypothetical protein
MDDDEQTQLDRNKKKEEENALGWLIPRMVKSRIVEGYEVRNLLT